MFSLSVGCPRRLQFCSWLCCCFGWPACRCWYFLYSPKSNIDTNEFNELKREEGGLGCYWVDSDHILLFGAGPSTFYGKVKHSGRPAEGFRLGHFYSLHLRPQVTPLSPAHEVTHMCMPGLMWGLLSKPFHASWDQTLASFLQHQEGTPGCPGPQSPGSILYKSLNRGVWFSVSQQIIHLIWELREPTSPPQPALVWDSNHSEPSW